MSKSLFNIFLFTSTRSLSLHLTREKTYFFQGINIWDNFVNMLVSVQCQLGTCSGGSSFNWRQRWPLSWVTSLFFSFTRERNCDALQPWASLGSQSEVNTWPKFHFWGLSSGDKKLQYALICWSWRCWWKCWWLTRFWGGWLNHTFAFSPDFNYAFMWLPGICTLFTR